MAAVMANGTHQRLTKAARLALPAVAVLLMATSCAGTDDSPTMTHEQAKQKTEAYFADVFAALPQPVTAVADRDSDGWCFKNDAPSEEDGRTMAVTSRYLRGIPADHHAATFDAFRDHLVKAGFKVTSSHADAIFLKNPKDDFSATIDDGGDWSTTLHIAFVSPCVWPNGTKPPTG
ncbi:hypothetical protein AB0F71_03550 [Kitasatospora sp. NPDC028055]|uniref:hypothetical protein n=1 Tax=Kitasatospora sp. NPDC028055 TaxID=3155653 RepID=UPI00340B3D6C